MKFTRLLCNGMEQPLGYDFHHPCLTWVVDSPHRDDGQVAYRLEVALEPSFAATVYDSGRTTSDQTAASALARTGPLHPLLLAGDSVEPRGSHPCHQSCHLV